MQGSPTTRSADSDRVVVRIDIGRHKAGLREPRVGKALSQQAFVARCLDGLDWIPALEFPGVSATCAAVTTDASSTPTTASTGHCALNSLARSADSAGA